MEDGSCILNFILLQNATQVFYYIKQYNFKLKFNIHKKKSTFTQPSKHNNNIKSILHLNYKT
jgi:hypothetical protein